MPTQKSLQETDQFFSNLAQRKNIVYSSYEYIINNINDALPTQNTETLLDLIPFMQSGDGHYAFRYLGEARRIFNILSIISLECKFGKDLFSTTCTSYEQLSEKYQLSLFALRRLTVNLSETSINDAVYFLQNLRLSPFAFFFLLKNELVLSNDEMYETIICINENIWSTEDVQQFLMLVTSNNNS